MAETTWLTTSSLELEEVVVVVEVVAGLRLPEEDPEMAEPTAELTRGWIWETTEDTMESESRLEEEEDCWLLELEPKVEDPVLDPNPELAESEKEPKLEDPVFDPNPELEEPKPELEPNPELEDPNPELEEELNPELDDPNPALEEPRKADPDELAEPEFLFGLSLIWTKFSLTSRVSV